MSTPNCPFCLSPLGEQEQYTCPSCDTTYHLECYEWNGACGTFGCPAWKQAQDEAYAAAAQAPATAPEPAGAVASAPQPAAPVMAPAVLNFCDHCGVRVEGAPTRCPSCKERLDP